MNTQTQTRKYNDKETNFDWLVNRFTALGEFLLQKPSQKFDGIIIEGIRKYLIRTPEINQELTIEWFDGLYAQMSEEQFLAKYS